MMLAAAWQFSLLGLPARFERPEALLFLAVTALVSVFWMRDLVRRGKLLKKTVPDAVAWRMAPAAGRSRGLAGGTSVLTGLVLLSIAAAQPQCGTHTVLAKRFGMDVVIALDASSSMLARDVKPSRIERAKLELGGLIDRLGGDRVGIVAFAGSAFIQCPLTNDAAAAKLFLRAIDPGAIPQQGTALAEALDVSGRLLEGGDRGAAGRAIVLITDGEDHEGAAIEKAKALAQEGVRVFTVGIGSVSGEPIPLVDKNDKIVGYKKDHQGNTVMTRLNERILEEIAEAANGRYVYSAAGDLGIGEIHEELQRMDKAEFESRHTVQYDERYPIFAGIGLLLVCLGFLTGEGRWRRRRSTP